MLDYYVGSFYNLIYFDDLLKLIYNLIYFDDLLKLIYNLIKILTTSFACMI